MMSACVLDMLDDDEQKKLQGCMLGSKNIKRKRKTLQDMWAELGCYARKAYRMSMDAFDLLHGILESALKEEFNLVQRALGSTPNGDIPTKLWLSAALRFFDGAAVYDIMLTHGMGRQTVYKSIYGVVDCVNKDKSPTFNLDDAKFSSHNEQREIAAGFQEMSGADFDRIVLALDGMLVWTIQPSKKDCEFLKIGERMFHRQHQRWQCQYSCAKVGPPASIPTHLGYLFL